MIDVERHEQRDWERRGYRVIGEAATKGPWEWVNHTQRDGYSGIVSESGEEVLFPSCCNDGDDGAAWFSVEGLSDADATFIAAAREGWPAALDEVKRLSGNIHAYAYESGRVSLKCQDQSKEIEILKRQLQIAAKTARAYLKCPKFDENNIFCDKKDLLECKKNGASCWLEYWRRKAGEGAK